MPELEHYCVADQPVTLPQHAQASPLLRPERCWNVDRRDVGQGSGRHWGGNGHIPMGLRSRDDDMEGEHCSKPEVGSYPSRQRDTDCQSDQRAHIETVALAEGKGLVPAHSWVATLFCQRQ